MKWVSRYQEFRVIQGPIGGEIQVMAVDMETEVDTETGKDPIDFLVLILAGEDTDMEHVLRDDLAIIRDLATIECS
jgi:hypothetical protein